MHTKALQHLPKQQPLHCIIRTFEVQEASVQLIAVCLCLNSKVLQGKDTVKCRQLWSKTRSGVRTKVIVLCRFHKPGVQDICVKAHDGFSDNDGPVIICAERITLLEHWCNQATVHIPRDMNLLESCV